MRTENASTKQPSVGGRPSFWPWRPGLGLGLALALGCGGGGQGSIGASLLQEPSSGALRVREVPESMSGAKAGLQRGDEIVAIDGVDARGLSAEEVHKQLSGTVGTKVELTVVRDGTIHKIVVTRGPYKKRPEKP